MTTRVVLRSLALTQISEAARDYEAFSRRGADFLDAVDARLKDLSAFLFSCALLFADVPRAMLGGFSYHLLYAIRDDGDQRNIVILACVHERSNPKSWRKLN